MAERRREGGRKRDLNILDAQQRPPKSTAHVTRPHPGKSSHRELSEASVPPQGLRASTEAEPGFEPTGFSLPSPLLCDGGQVALPLCACITCFLGELELRAGGEKEERCFKHREEIAWHSTGPPCAAELLLL